MRARVLCEFATFILFVEALAAGLFALPASAGSITEKTKYEYYYASGQTALDIVMTMDRASPRIGRKEVWGMMDIDPDFEPVPASGPLCKYADMRINVSYTITIPAHKQENALSPKLRRQFQSFARFVKRHEEEHRQIYRRCFRDMRRAMLAVRGHADCETYLKTLYDIVDRHYQRCDASDNRIDDRDVPLVERQPLFRAALAQVETGQERRALEAAVSAGSGGANRRSNDPALPVFTRN